MAATLAIELLENDWNQSDVDEGIKPHPLPDEMVDPNSYANVAWIFGKHDRPWQERPIYGKVRYMNANGLRRKFDPERYAEMFGDPDDHSS